ncbi:hypothetical protein BH11ACT3_BH11ACT3_03010 [soil metagenome]
MSPRAKPAVTDEQGRPIVAELGRAETPDETAARKAENSRKHRSNQTMLNLVAALIVSLGVVVLLVLVVVRPDGGRPDPVDYQASAVQAQGAVDVHLAAPDLPSTWSANRAELVTAGADGVTSWRIGFVTPSDQYLALDQGIAANPTWVSALLDGAKATGSATIAGIDWKVYDRRDVADPGNVAYALVADVGSGDDVSTVVLSGTASDAEFQTLADAVVAELAP